MGAEMEEVVDRVVALLDDAAARGALRDAAATARGGAPPLRRRAVRALHFLYCIAPTSSRQASTLLSSALNEN